MQWIIFPVTKHFRYHRPPATDIVDELRHVKPGFTFYLFLMVTMIELKLEFQLC